MTTQQQKPAGPIELDRDLERLQNYYKSLEPNKGAQPQKTPVPPKSR